MSASSCGCNRTFHSEKSPSTTSIVKLNVGGMFYCTSKETLCRVPNTYFTARFGNFCEPEGTVFVDRDGTRFRHVLNYLRDGSLHLGSDPSSALSLARELLEEAGFFQLDGLAASLRSVVERSRTELEQAAAAQESLLLLLNRTHPAPSHNSNQRQQTETSRQPRAESEFRLDEEF